MWDYLKLLDLRVENAAQAAYDYAWDRWGLGIGTVRYGALLFILGLIIVMPSGADPNSMGAMGMSAMSATASLIMFGVMAFMLLLGTASGCWLWMHQNRLQANGDHTMLNARAMHQDFRARVQSMCWQVIWASVLLFVWHAWAVAVVVIVLDFYMGYALALKVRKRDESRFKAHDFAMQGSL